ncbi:multicopper oxidase domain-containing protein (plasmid) [Haladaptatus sp. SPP-AMP-3]
MFRRPYRHGSDGNERQRDDVETYPVIVPSHMGTVTFDFLADNPGDWLFHCHNLYHLGAGMSRVVTYGTG